MYIMAKICVDCGYEPTIYLCNLYQCYNCGKKDICSACIAFIEGDVGTDEVGTDEVGTSENPREQKRICVNCFDTTSVRNCNDCHKVCRSEFSTCWTCHKTDICDYCIYYLSL